MTMNPSGHDIIGMSLIDAFAQRGYRAELTAPDTVAVTLKDGNRAQADIAQWRQHAGRNPRSALPGIAAQYADQAVQAFERQAPPAPSGGGLDTASLRVRLYPENALDERMQAALVTRPFAPGLLQAVVVDYPDSIVPLNRADLGGLAEAAAFGHALAQSIEREPHYVQPQDLNGVKMSNIGEQHRYIGAHAQVLRRHFPGPLPFGALVAFPLPEYVTVHEIGTEQHLVLALKTMQDVAARLAGSGEKPITAQVYWWRPGQYEAMAERDALFSGRVPDLRPVGVQVEQDGERLQVGLVGDHTAELVQGWEAARG
ncbi:hypothetical protein [Actinomadura welshii]|uniref:hypothetical protein n=1 Tax=Actinomadura welshii TaxID=3103817 RepID=UPI000466FEFD|nr:hypothetical protein [Actinomadura madurae]